MDLIQSVHESEELVDQRVVSHASSRLVGLAPGLADGVYLIDDDDEEVAEGSVLLPAGMGGLEVGAKVLLRLAKVLADNLRTIDQRDLRKKKRASSLID